MGRDAFWRDTLKIAVPVALQFLLSNLLNLADIMMVGFLGEQPLAGVTAGNNVFFIYSLFVVGVACGGGIFAAQYMGRRDQDGIRRVLGISLAVGGVLVLLFTALLLGFGGPMQRLFTADPVVAAYSKQYSMILLISYLPAMAMECYAGVLKNSGRPNLSFIAAVVGLGLNVLLNYILIFGNWGAPVLGVAGAAIATVIARWVQLGLLLVLVYAGDHPVACHPKKLFSFHREQCVLFLKVCLPVMINEGLWAMGTTAYNAIYGQMGTKELAVIAIVGNIERIFLFVFMGMAYASLGVVGKKIGENDHDTAYRYSLRYARLSFFMGVGMGVLLIVFAPFLVGIYHVTPEARQMAIQLLTILGCVVGVRTFNLTNIIGLLRTGGDTMASARIDLISLWLVGVPLVFLGGMILHLPMYVVYAMALAEEGCKLLMGVPYLRSRKWLRAIG